MTTPLTEPEHLPWWRYLGPWPLRPGAMLLFIILASVVSSGPVITAESLPRYAVAAVASGFIGAAILWLAENFAGSLVRTAFGYIVILSVVSTALASIRYLTRTSVEYEQFSGFVNFTASVTRNVLIALLVLAILGVNSRRLQRQVDQTQEALHVVRAQAQALLEADETVRQQVAAALHDRVQAGLIGACLQLQSVISRIDTPEADVITRVIDSLEELRGLDVRRAVRSLSPNLREVDLQSALQELTENYSPGMTTTISIDIATAPYEVRLGAYRIIEQSLMNSAMHGNAAHCDVSIHERPGILDVRVTDDGVGLPDEIAQGLGSTLISTWCRTLEGSWSREPLPTGGTLVRARLKIPS